jgi:creatinine amidohydrolase
LTDVREESYRRYLPQMSSAAVRQARSRGVCTVIVPLGATEQHGPHAPLSTDTIVAEEVAIRLAARIDALVAPALPVSLSQQHLAFAGSLSLSVETLVRVICEVVTSLAGQGFWRFVLLSGHGGNRTAIDVAARELKARHGREIEVMVLNLLALQTSRELKKRAEKALGTVFRGIWEAHGGEQETSAAMARDERLGHPELAPPEAGGIEGYLTRTRDPWAWIVTFDLARYAPHGTWGDARGASARQGQVVLELMAEMMAERMSGKWER